MEKEKIKISIQTYDEGWVEEYDKEIKNRESPQKD